jgi:alpha-tubulin suppressor-like RCC1 family protein
MTPISITGLSNAKAIAGGYRHSLAISNSGNLFAWGVNEDYQLGNGTNVNSPEPVQIGNENNWIDVACGDYHSLALNSAGEVFAWGRNTQQQCGIEGGGLIQTPTKITFPEQVIINKIVACSDYSLLADTLVLKKVYGCGINRDYLLSSTNLNGLISTPTAISDFSNAVLIAAGTNVCGVVKNESATIRGRYDFTIDSISLGNFVSPPLNATTDCAKFNPVASVSSAVVPILNNSAASFLDFCIGDDFLLVIKQDGSLWGYTFGDIGCWQKTFSTSKTQKQAENEADIPDNSSIGNYGLVFTARRSDLSGTYSGTDWRFYPQGNNMVLIEDSFKFIKMRCGKNHVLFLDEDQKLYSWGSNNFGQLGRTTPNQNDKNIVRVGEEDKWSDIACGNYHSLVILNYEELEEQPG